MLGKNDPVSPVEHSQKMYYFHCLLVLFNYLKRLMCMECATKMRNWFVSDTIQLRLFFYSSGLPKLEVCQEYYGVPPPPVAFGPPLRLNIGDIVELNKAEAEQLWWQVNVIPRTVQGQPRSGTIRLWRCISFI